jgi:hypothetical protein
MKKISKKYFQCFLLFLFFCFCFKSSFAQEEKPRFLDRMFFGGGLGLQFGDYTVIDIAPIVGYKLTEKFSAGVGVTYIYEHLKQSIVTTTNIYYLDYKTNIYGGSVFAKYYLFNDFFGYAEYGILNMDVPSPFSYNEFMRDNVESMLVGGGYREMLGGKVGLELEVLWDVLDEPYSPYGNGPIIRAGIVAGF